MKLFLLTTLALCLLASCSNSKFKAKGPRKRKAASDELTRVCKHITLEFVKIRDLEFVKNLSKEYVQDFDPSNWEWDQQQVDSLSNVLVKNIKSHKLPWEKVQNLLDYLGLYEIYILENQSSGQLSFKVKECTQRRGCQIIEKPTWKIELENEILSIQKDNGKKFELFIYNECLGLKKHQKYFHD
jgi:hypothetical protein